MNKKLNQSIINILWLIDVIAVSKISDVAATSSICWNMIGLWEITDNHRYK